MTKRLLPLGVALTALLAITGCNNNEPANGALDPNTMVYINVVDGKTRAVANPDLPDNPAHLSPTELVKQAEWMLSTGAVDGIRGELWLGGIIEEGEYLTEHGRKAGEYQYKLIDQAKFVFWGDFVLDINYKDPDRNLKLDPYWFTAKDVVFEDKDRNIIGYIPQRILRAAWAEVQKYFNAKEYDKVYQIFRDTYQAYPCTPDEWEKLKAEGKN